MNLESSMCVEKYLLALHTLICYSYIMVMINLIKLILLSGLVLVGLTLQSPWEELDLQ